jgi:prophage regulatory protein
MEKERMILRKNEVAVMVKLSHPTIWRLEKLGKFPARVKLGDRAVGWYSNEIDEWIKSRERVSQ